MTERPAARSLGAGEKPRPTTLVTGGTGFLGGHLVRLLLGQGRSVVTLVRPGGTARPSSNSTPGTTVLEADLCDVHAVRRVIDQCGVEAVFHLAGDSTIHASRLDPTRTFHTNIRGTWSVLEACRLSPAVRSVVVASSDKAYGEGVDLPYREDTPLLGRGPYEVSKACGDLLSQSYGAHFGLPVAIARPGNFFGGGDLNWSRLVPSVIRAALRGEVIQLRSDGTAVRDYLYIEDAADAFVRIGEAVAAHERLAGEAFNVSSRNRMTVLEFVGQLVDAVGGSAGLLIGPPNRTEIVEQYLDPRRVEHELGWTPATPHQEAVRRTIEWYADHLADGSIPAGDPAARESSGRVHDLERSYP